MRKTSVPEIAAFVERRLAGATREEKIQATQDLRAFLRTAYRILRERGATSDPSTRSDKRAETARVNGNTNHHS